MFGERAVGVVSADERDPEQVVVELEVVELDAGKAEREQAGVERDGRSAEVAVNPRVRAQDLYVQAGDGVDRGEHVGGWGFADRCGGGVELGTDLPSRRGSSRGVVPR